MLEPYKKFLKQDPNNWMWLIAFYAVSFIIIVLLTLKI